MPPSSGASCPGLIEAEVRKQLSSLSRNAHPGLLAPASLKHTTTMTTLTPEAAAHPGLLAPASLKHIMARADLLLKLAHPGLLAPASLKL